MGSRFLLVMIVSNGDSLDQEILVPLVERLPDNKSRIRI